MHECNGVHEYPSTRGHNNLLGAAKKTARMFRSKIIVLEMLVASVAVLRLLKPQASPDFVVLSRPFWSPSLALW